MRAQRRCQGSGRTVGLAKLNSITFLAIALWFAPAAIAQDTGQIRITLTVPQKIQARVQTSRPISRTQDICVASAESVAFSVAALIMDAQSWRLRPLRLATPESAAACITGKMLSIEADSGNPVTLILSPE